VFWIPVIGSRVRVATRTEGTDEVETGSAGSPQGASTTHGMKPASPGPRVEPGFEAAPFFRVPKERPQQHEPSWQRAPHLQIRAWISASTDDDETTSAMSCSPRNSSAITAASARLLRCDRTLGGRVFMPIQCLLSTR